VYLIGGARSTGTPLATLALSVLFGSACEGASGERVADIDDGVPVVVSDARVVDTPIGWSVDSVPDLEIGGAGSAEVLDRVAGVHSLPSGGVFVLEGRSGLLRWFDGDGALVRREDRRGDGPDEFLRPELVPQSRIDSLLVMDRRRRRLVRIALDGSGSREFGSGVPTGAATAATATSVAFLSGSADHCRPNEHCVTSTALRLYRPGSAALDTIVTFGGTFIDYQGPEGAFGLPGPLDAKQLVAPTASGYVVEGPAPFELLRFDAEGRLEARLRVDAGGWGASSEQLIEELVRDSPMPGLVRAMNQRLRLPDEPPAFRELLVDAVGWTWARLYRTTPWNASLWLVFDPQGQARGTIRLPTGLQVHEVGEDFVLGVWRDSLDVETVRRFPLSRARPPLSP
jgi:hypothetical protein